ncbi:hypothetical protein GCM10027258_47900 [Amycolatopsis stemonae]
MSGRALPLQLPQDPHHLIDAGVTLRPPRIPLPPTPPGLVYACHHGRSIRQLGTTHGMSYSQTPNILLAEGVDLRRRGQS